MNSSYCIITPCRNEARFARQTLDSVAAQSIRPAVWIIVDDGSEDETPAILADYASRFDFIKIIRRDDRGHRSVGPGVINAFYQGLDTVDLDSFDYICKLDLDLILPPRYFEILMQRMAANPRLGTCSGKAYYVDPATNTLVSEKISDEMSIGASKFYRTGCFSEIGGFSREVMWDGIDCHRCRMLGWIACSWDDPDLRFTHLRPMGSSEKGIWRGRVRHGQGQYYMGTGIVYMTVSALYRLSRPPYVIGGVAMWWGFVKSWLGRKPRYNDVDFRKFLRRYQWRCLLQGKALATSRVDQDREPVWKADHTITGPDKAKACI